MKKHLIRIAILIGLASSLALAQTPGSSVVRLDPALDAIISPAAKLEVLFTTPGGTEGPIWVKNGQYLLFTSSERTHKGKVYRLSDGNLSVFFEPTGGGNGLALDRDGRLIICAMEEKALRRVEKNGTVTTLAEEFAGKRIDGPNDIAVKSDGAIYFTDELSVFRLKDGKLQQLMKSVVPGGNVVNGSPGGRVVNGIALSPDEKFLYVVVVPTPGTSRRIARYELRPDGTIIGEPRPGKTITDERIWFPLPDQNPPPTRQSGQPDGIKVDLKGNVYFGGPGGVWIVSPAGKHLGTILIPTGHSNLAFGDADGKTLYFTLGTGVARIRLNAPGI